MGAAFREIRQSLRQEQRQQLTSRAWEAPSPTISSFSSPPAGPCLCEGWGCAQGHQAKAAAYFSSSSQEPVSRLQHLWTHRHRQISTLGTLSYTDTVRLKKSWEMRGVCVRARVSECVCVRVRTGGGCAHGGERCLCSQLYIRSHGNRSLLMDVISTTASPVPFM